MHSTHGPSRGPCLSLRRRKFPDSRSEGGQSHSPFANPSYLPMERPGALALPSAPQWLTFVPAAHVSFETQGRFGGPSRSQCRLRRAFHPIPSNAPAPSPLGVRTGTTSPRQISLTLAQPSGLVKGAYGIQVVHRPPRRRGTGNVQPDEPGRPRMARPRLTP